MQSAHWILNFDADNICGNGSWIAPEDEEAILAPGMAPLLETKINTKKPKISNYAFGSRDGSSAGDALSLGPAQVKMCSGQDANNQSLLRENVDLKIPLPSHSLFSKPL